MITRERPRASNILKPVDNAAGGGEESKTAAFVRDPGGGSRKEPMLSAFGFRRNPFPVVPDATGFYLSRRNEAILAEVLHSIETRKGFMVLTGEVGLGKTTLSRRILMELEGRGVRAALVFNTFHQGADLLREINRDFGVDVESDDLSVQMAALNRFLLANLAAGTNCAIVIDDAQQLSVASLELVRQVSNLETDNEKLVQILLIGQPELDETLARYELRQLASRVVLARQVEPLTLEETTQYVEFKLAQASGYGRLKVTSSAFRLLHKLTGGNPRRINALMDRSLYAAIVFDTDRIDRSLLATAAEDADPGRGRGAGRRSRRVGRRLAQVAVLLLAVVLLAALLLGPGLARQGAAAVWQAAAGALSRLLPGGPDSRPAAVETAAVDAVRRQEAGPEEAPPEAARLEEAAPPPAAEALSATAASADAEEAEPVAAEPAAPLRDVEPFLAAYGLEAYAADLAAGFDNGWLDEAAARIRLGAGLRLVSLPSLPADLEGYPVYAWTKPDGSEEYLLFWRPRLWSPANQYFQYRQPEVRAMQRGLARLGFYDAEIDGLPGPMTSTALRRFQASVDLKPSGLPDATTLFLLELRGGPGDGEAESSPVESETPALSLPIM